MQHTLNYRTEWIEMINTLPDENDRNALLAAISLYQINGQIPNLSPTLNLVFLFIKKEIDEIILQIQIAEAKKEARRMRRNNRPAKPQSQHQEPEPIQESEPTQKPEPVQESEPIQKSNQIQEQITPPPTPPKNKPASRNKNFNSLTRAKNQHDRNRKKRYNLLT